MHRLIVYALCDPETLEIRYIGKSVSGLRRPKAHTSPHSLKSPTHKNRWIKSLLRQGLYPLIVVLEDVRSQVCLGQAEIRHIRCARLLGVRLTNATDGGDGALGRKWSASQHERMMRALKGRPRPRTVINAMANARTGKALTQQHRLKISDALKGRTQPPRTAAWRLAQSASHRGKTVPEDTRLKMSRAHGGKPVLCVETGEVFSSQSEAARKKNLSVGNVNKVLHGVAKSTGGMTFRFIHE